MVKSMKPGSVIVDVAVDQGGCIETIHETTHKEPVYEQHGVLHYAVGNMPGAVPHTSTYALTNATLPYLIDVAKYGTRAAAQRNCALKLGVNTVNGQITNDAAAKALGLEAVDSLTVLTQ
jgi:alanine dehydrogenase